MNANPRHPQARTEIEAERMVLILIDVINDLAADDITQDFVRDAIAAAGRIRALKQRARAAGIPVVYANDNFGQWRADFSGVIAHCTQPGMPGKPVSEQLLPEDDDYFILKPRHSGFFATSLPVLLEHLGRDTLVLTGFSGEVCVLFTAHDAYMHEYGLFVPEDCIASIDAEANRRALDLMRRVTKADTRPSTDYRFD